jgi:hypothetical protein
VTLWGWHYGCDTVGLAGSAVVAPPASSASVPLPADLPLALRMQVMGPVLGEGGRLPAARGLQVLAAALAHEYEEHKGGADDEGMPELPLLNQVPRRASACGANATPVRVLGSG